MWRLRLMAASILAALSGCTTILGSGSSQETSRADEPPASWESAVLFQFRDSLSDPHTHFAARVELVGDVTAARTVTAHDVYLTESNLLRTPWYRIRLAGGEPQRQAAIRIVLEHAPGPSR
jgi:hypothetical protein